MLKKNLLAPALAAVALVATPGAADAAKPMKYAGKTKEGTKITFALDGPWVDQISTLLPHTCVSAQGGPPTAGMTPWAPPYKFRLGSVDAKVTVEDPWPTTHYTITVKGKRGRAIRGKLAANWAMTVPYNGGWRILECISTGSFTAKPKK
jgi:hypothetical protein